MTHSNCVLFQNVNNNNDRNNNNNNNNDNANMNMNPAKRKRRVAMATQDASKKAVELDLARVKQLIQSPLNEVNLAHIVITSFISDIKNITQ